MTSAWLSLQLTIPLEADKIFQPRRKNTDALPPPQDDEQSRKCQRMQFKNDLGCMYKWRKEAIIQFHRFNREKEPSKLYRSKILLYLPWRNESVDLLGGYPDFCSHYENVSAIIIENEEKYSQNAALIEEGIEDLAMYGPPQHAWDQVAPGAAEQQAQDQAEGIEEERSIEQEDLQIVEQQQHRSNPLLERVATETSRVVIPPEHYRALVRRLNCKQRQMINFDRRWCKNVVISMKNGQPTCPYRVFLSGPGGVGKSHVISLIHYDTVKPLRLSGQVQPNDVTVLLTAPTGVAAFNI